MRDVELLAPSGTMESLHAAVQAGCDAVYLGGTMFGARAFAGNFDEEEMKEAIRYAHRFGVKVYVTMNTLIYSNEMEAALSYARFLYEEGADALLVQDIGLADRIHQEMPDFELHASTQMHIHNHQGIETARRLGLSRVVLPRETTAEQMRELCRDGMEIEVFVHGALCLCYSGQCLMSSTLLHRSGNRGECAQPCRMKYELWRKDQGKDHKIETEGDYLLSPKDLFTLQDLPVLLDAGVHSLKIEGRMKKPEYVAQVVSMYRQAIDAWKQKRGYTPHPGDVASLQKLFSRGFTKGYAFHEPGRSMMNAFRPNHQGTLLGHVVSLSRDRICIRLEDDLNQGDGIRILSGQGDEGCIVNRLYKNDLLVSHGQKGDLVEIDRKVFALKNAEVRRTSDVILQQELMKRVQKGSRKVAVHVSLRAHAGEKLYCMITDEEGFCVETQSEEIIQPAQKAPLSETALYQAFAQMGDTPFQMESFVCDLEENCFLSVKAMKQLRRRSLDQLRQLRENRNKNRRYGTYEKRWKAAQKHQGVFVCVQDQQQYDVCARFGIENIYTDRASLYQKLQTEGKKVLFHEGNVVFGRREADMGGENGALTLARKTVDSTLNLTNTEAVAFASRSGVETMILSLEHDIESLQELCAGIGADSKAYPDLAVMVYGHRDLMTSQICVINTCVKDGTKRNCRLCREHRYYLKDLKGHCYPLNNDEQCLMRILSETADDHIDDLEAYAAMGIASYYLRFTCETAEETSRVLSRFYQQLHS